MPRTQINYHKPPADMPVADPSVPGGTRIVRESVVHVTWMAAHKGEYDNGHVQVALEVDMAYARTVLATPNGESPDTTYLYSPGLSREEINRMIRALRAARDRAYGTDA